MRLVFADPTGGEEREREEKFGSEGGEKGRGQLDSASVRALSHSASSIHYTVLKTTLGMLVCDLSE